MSFKQILQVRLISRQCSIRQSHNYATVYESNDSKNVGKHAKVQGWVQAFRKIKDKIFLDVNDGTSSQALQVVLEKDAKPENLSYGCSVAVEGGIALAPNGRPELQAEKITVIGKLDLEGYPFLPRKQYSPDYIRQYLHFRPRTRSFASIIRLRDQASNAIRDHMRNRNFINIHTPILTSNDCEGAGEIFNVEPSSKKLMEEMKKENINDLDAAYFNTKTFLTVSGQLQLEVCARALAKVYNFSPAFRAENSKSRLHLSEFYMIETEIAFMSSLKELAAEAELLIKATTMNLLEKGAKDLQAVNAPEPTWIGKDFGYITYNEAVDILEKHSDKLNFPVKRGEVLVREHEFFLVKHYGNIPLFVAEWPKHNKPFYMKECENDSSKVKALDLLAPMVGELVGGSVREDNYDKLKSKLPENANLDWYLELRKYGNVPTAGFGMGFERYLQFVLGVPNIKDVIPFPRWPHNCCF
ncbi:probable asparagine--tRNA ligase, mitochondrial [Phymastichus coffea]|uniref:probable asparagine--tRNA ligase, mitochondrial n=1 Tax=Phymastichus coffea TaxID=108790 RepID=UPI00273CC92C|nr:probable asparagine--tRNA ligase, mitochondrial [Phymastichus coffea]XP_058805602.1 probable asparagine--tRNA ligase, mitochondrial [Phymastichus coffea]XP_058805603.1 probable asparagine--tRNA ligase, mitochondrial [Phymastichus coffea]XP_058805604.1 probable asparagine--tRNA ligase, mitochondrial [Phymastichus coffea]XP_058805605.1 probable asparagine--tRNA ligase, mitochondrial [Phymastichus coffea]XP_058805606.1 probable asparagine--tRNA ligase, mitochondrial [Phymastichus coffea]